MPGEMEEKVAFVTGGGSGIGRAIGRAFAAERAKVAIADVSDEKGNETVQLIKKMGGEAIHLPCDVSKTEAVSGAIRETVKIFGRLDYAINNAGIPGEHHSIVDYPEKVWHQVLAINLTGVWLCMKYEIPQMLKQGSGGIVNIASIAGLAANRGASPYVASKHGVIGLTKAAALEFAERGIRINAICPGITDTPLIQNAMTEVPEELRKVFTGEKIPMGRMALPEEIAGAAVWLCSKDASFVTGHALVIDGGMLAE